MRRELGRLTSMTGGAFQCSQRSRTDRASETRAASRRGSSFHHELADWLHSAKFVIEKDAFPGTVAKNVRTKFASTEFYETKATGRKMECTSLENTAFQTLAFRSALSQ